LGDSSTSPTDPCQASELESHWHVSIVLQNSINVSQENRCFPWNVLEEDVRYTVTTRCLSTLQFLNQVLNLSWRCV
jgi:hypothetical protein